VPRVETVTAARYRLKLRSWSTSKDPGSRMIRV
jgi:hypothetical protein